MTASLKKPNNLLLTGFSLLLTFIFSLLLTSLSQASDLNDSWPQFQTNAQASDPAHKKVQRKQKKRRYRKRKKRPRKTRKNRHARAYKKRKATRKYLTKRNKTKKRKASMSSRMTNHDAESKRKPKIITAKSFEYPDLMTDAAKIGEGLFNEHCIGCHGKNALGTQSGPPLLHDYYRPAHHADIAIYAAPLYGVEAHHWKFGNMPKIEVITKKNAHNLIIYLRTLQRANGIY